MLAMSTREAQSSKLGTLAYFVQLATGEDLFPLSVAKLTDALAGMKAVGYRSVDGYLAAARKKHVSLGYRVDECFRAWLRDATRSVLRGIGPARQAVVVDVGQLAGVLPGEPAERRGWPVQAGLSFLVASWWMLREA